MENPELNKYLTLYRLQEKGEYNERYGHTNHGKDAFHFLKDAKSILDVGCGHNEFITSIRDYKRKKADEFGLPVSEERLCLSFLGTDFACAHADALFDITQEDFIGLFGIKEYHFEWITAFDVLEHLQESQLSQAFRNMSLLADNFCFSISYRDSKHKVNGETLHPIVRSEEWWIDYIKQYGTVMKYRHFLLGDWNSNATPNS